MLAHLLGFGLGLRDKSGYVEGHRLPSSFPALNSESGCWIYQLGALTCNQFPLFTKWEGAIRPPAVYLIERNFT